MKKNNAAYLVIICIIGIGAILWKPITESRSHKEQITIFDQELANLVEPTVERTLSTSRSFELIDQLTGKQIPLELVQWNSEAHAQEGISSEEVGRVAIEELQGYWLVRTPQGEILPPVSLSSTTDNGRDFSLPYSSSLRIKVSNLSSGAQIPTLRVSQYWMDRVKYLNLVGGGGSSELETFLPKGQVEFFVRQYEQRYGKDNKWGALGEKDDGTFHYSSFGSGYVAVQVEHPSFGAKMKVIDLVAGSLSELHFGIRERPILKGKLIDDNSQGIANQPLDVLVLLDNQDINLGGEQDSGFSLLVAGLPGEYNRVARAQVTTNLDGDFSVQMPRGLQYAVEYRGETAYGFAESVAYPHPPEGDVLLNIQAFEFDEGYQVVVKDTSAVGIARVFVQAVIADDFPWFRQIPAVSTNENGECSLPLLKEGMEKIRFYVRLKADTLDFVHRTPLMRLGMEPLEIEIE